MIHLYKLAAGESPCSSAIAGIAGRAPRFSRKHCKPEISKRSNIFTDKRKARFSLKSKLFKTDEFFASRKTLLKTKARGGEEE